MVSTTAFATPRWRGPALPFVPPPARIPRSEQDHPLRPSRAGALSLPVPTKRTPPLCLQGPSSPAPDLRLEHSYPPVLLGTVPVRCAPAANFSAQRHGRPSRLVPSLTKSGVHHCYIPTPDQAWQVFHLAEKSFLQGDVPGSPGKFVFPGRRCRRQPDAVTRGAHQRA